MVSATMAWASDVTTAEELKTAFTTGSDVNVYVTNDIELTETIVLSGTRSITLDLKGHTITSNGVRAFQAKSGTLVITSSETGGKIMTVGAINIESSVIRVGDAETNVNTASLTIQEGVTIASDVCYGVTVFGKNTGDKSESLIVNGKIQTKVRPAIAGNGSAGLSSTTITVNETAEIETTDDVAIYHPQAGTLTVDGKVTGAGGIEIKGGELVVGDHAVISATGLVSHSVNNDGTSTRGYAIAIVENGAYSGVSTVNISKDATIVGPVAVVKDSDNATTAGVTFDGSGMQMAVKVTDAESKSFGQYLSLELAMSQAPSGSTIQLLGDCRTTQKIQTNKNYTLDLNGHTVTCDGDRALHVMGGNVTITSTAEGGKIESVGGVAKNSSVIRLGDNTGDSRTAQLTIDEKVTVAAETCYGITVFGNKTTETLVVNGKISTIDYPAIGGNGSAGYGGTTITIGANAEISSEKELAIYQPQDGTLTVNGKVTGNGGIELKGGSLTVGSTATIEATGTPTHKPYSNGSSTLGYAIAIVENNDGYAGVSAVSVDNAATIIGPIVQIKDSDKDGFNPTYTGDAVSKKVAAIGEDQYFTLKDAVNIVPTEGTIKLLDNLTLYQTLVMDKVKTYTLDLAGKTLTGDNCAALQIASGHITLDGTAGSQVTVSGTPVAAIQLGATDTGGSRNVSLTVRKDVAVASTVSTGILVKGSNTRETLEVLGKITTSGHSAIVAEDEMAKIHVAKDAEVKTTDAVVIYQTNNGLLEIDGKVTGAGTTAGAIEMKGGNLTVSKDATVTAVGTLVHEAKNDVPSTNGYAIAIVENANFAGVGKANIDKEATISGVIACLVDSKNTSAAEPMFTGDIYMTAETDGDKYARLTDAIAAASSLVTLLDDITVTEAVTINKNITLDMDDYSIIGSQTSGTTLNISAEVTLKNGGITTAKDGISISGSTVALQSMTVNTQGVSLAVSGGTATADQKSTFSSSADNTVALSGGSLTLNGKVLNTAAADKHAITGTGSGNLILENTVNVSSANSKAVNWESTGNLTINGGKVMGAEAVYVNAGTVTIDGGTFTGSGNAVQISAGTPTVNHGTFISGTSEPIVATSATGFVKGDYFSAKIDQKLCAAGYMVSPNKKNNGMYYLINEIVIYDGTDWTSPSTIDFTIETAKYIRNTGMGASGTKFGTLCLPFSINLEATQVIPDGMTFYSVTSINDAKSEITITKINTEIAAGTPVVFQFESAQTEFEIVSTQATISKDGAKTANNLVGTFAKQEIQSGLEDIYYLNSDAFHQANTSLTVPAFRAYIKFDTTTPARPEILNIVIDDETSDLQSAWMEQGEDLIFDLQGNLQDSLKPGMNIVKKQNGRTIKVYVKE